MRGRKESIAQFRPQQPAFRINNQIRVPQVRLIAADGANKGIVDTRDALDMARSAHLDLIEVAPNADPPVCRIIDYGRFLYEKEKKERAAKKSQKVIDIKGVQLRPKTTDHHLAFKIRAARRFLEQGNKVKVTLRFRGRESAHLHVARMMLDKVVQGVSDIAVVEVNPNVEGRAMLLILAPTQATLANAHLKSTQQRIEAEREADKAAGYDEEAEEAEVELEDDDDEIELKVEEPAKLSNEQEGYCRILKYSE
jgi:translation initiation factor IF-3